MGSIEKIGGAPGVDDEVDGLLHANVYQELRTRLITGQIVPGVGLSTRGLAAELGVSQTPVRDALSRLAAEGAVEIRFKRKMMVAAMTPERFEDLLRCRLLLEPEAARLSLAHMDAPRIRQLKEIDARTDEAMAVGDVNGYMSNNYAFHFTLYRAQPGRSLVQLIESLWLQFGPYMRVVYGRFGTAHLVDQHQLAIQAIERRDAEGLYKAIYSDISDGMGLIGKDGLETEAYTAPNLRRGRGVKLA